MTIKFTGLIGIASPANADLFVLTDTSATASRKITFADLKTSILDSGTFASDGPNIPLIITGINGFNPSTSNGLKATQLYHGSAYRDASYFLTYANIAGTPTVPTDVKDLTNTTGYVRFQGAVADSGTGLVWSGAGADNSGNSATISTSNIPEGTNQYYTLARGAEAVVANFATQFNIYNSTFDQGDVRDSLDAEAATFIAPILVTDGQNQSKTFRFAAGSYAKKANYAKGQILRLYGASTLFVSDAMATSFSVTVTGFATTTPTSKSGTGGAISYSYKIAEFDVVTGEISAASAAIVKTIGVPTTSGASTVAGAFNASVFNKLLFSSVPADKGVLVYRQIGTGGYELTAVLGRKEMVSGYWIDYQAFDFTAWSGKDVVSNTYTSITHFPLTPPVTSRRGWVDKTITSVVDNGGTFDVVVDDYVFLNSGNAVQVSHNDTQIIQSAINSNSAVDKKSIVLNAKTYNSSQISMPNNFGLVGTSYITKLKKLAWSGGEAGAGNAKFIKSAENSGATSLSIVGIDIEGNASNQFFFPDDTVKNTNYLLDFGTNCSSLLLDRVRINNAVGGGVWATAPIEMKMNSSEIINSGTTDRYSYSPLIADFGQDTMIVGNRFQNYTNYLDTSVTNKGIVANNVINNCGSGLFVYGSVFFISSPNVLMGPAQEFLPTPDILNSEYDLVNIFLQSAAGNNTYYNSPIHVYQEDGAVFDLSKTDGTINAVEYRAFYLAKTSTGVEEIYGTTTTFGAFVPTKRYTILSLGSTSQPNWNKAAGTGDANGTGTGARTYSVGDDFIAVTVGTGGGAGTATSGGVDTIVINDRPGDATRANGQFAFQIPAETVQAIRTTNGAHSYSTLSDATNLINNTTVKHVGIGWTASQRTEVEAGTISTSGAVWYVDAGPEDGSVNNNILTTSNDGTNPTYRISVTNLKYLAIGQKVRFKNHTGFSNSGNITTGIVRTITTNAAGISVIELQFMGAGGGETQSAALSGGLVASTAGGTINIIDTFVMAQGRII